MRLAIGDAPALLVNRGRAAHRRRVSTATDHDASRVTTLEATEWGTCLVPSVPVPAALAAEVKRLGGGGGGWLAYVAPTPWVARTTAVLSSRPLAFAPLPLCDVLGLIVSQDNSCRYCYGAQRAFMKLLGHTDAYIDRLERDAHLADLTPLDRTAIDLARRVSRGQPRPTRADVARLEQAGLTPEAAAEVVLAIAGITYANRLSTLLAFPMESIETLVDKPLFRLVRPFVAWQMRPRHAPPAPPVPAGDAPWGRLVAALGRSPTAQLMRQIVDEAIASPVLPRATKGLMMAVIGRALGCAYSEGEARRVARDDGVTSDEIDDVLANLGSSRLPQRDARLVAFARETVRYQTPVIQRRVREVTAGLTHEEILETVGIVGIANTLGRLSVVLDAC
jgi:alkylhydroperoxidase family enzyme